MTIKRLTPSEKERRFNRNKPVINRFVRKFLADKRTGIVHGTRATNAQLPSASKKVTKDWDVFVKRPELRARQLEARLDHRFRGDFFKVKRGKGSPGVKVWKVKSNVDDETVVDFATPNRRVPSISIRGVNFATVADQKARALRNVKRKDTIFRREKDLNLLKRIRKFEKVRGRKI